MLVAIEAEPDHDPQLISKLIAPIIRGYVTYFELFATPVFPRTESGKIRPEAVKALYRQRGLTR